MKIISLGLLAVIILSGCQTTPRIKAGEGPGKWIWYNKSLAQEVRDGSASENEYRASFDTSYAVCKSIAKQKYCGKIVDCNVTRSQLNEAAVMGKECLRRSGWVKTWSPDPAYVARVQSERRKNEKINAEGMEQLIEALTATPDRDYVKEIEEFNPGVNCTSKRMSNGTVSTRCY